MYKNYALAGLITCKDCNSFMTPSYTNKRKYGKLKRYYYYRCTSTYKKDWNSCSVKQVNADRLENYIFDNLERIFLDTDYIENLVFRINNDSGSGVRSGLELKEKCSPLSPEILQNRLKSFLKSFREKKGIEKNLSAKNFLKNIQYSNSNIKRKRENPNQSDWTSSSSLSLAPSNGRYREL